MTKSSGLGDNLYVAGNDLSGDINSIQNIHGGNSPLETTGINKAGFERVGGHRDGGLTFLAYHNATAGAAHPVLAALPTADVIVTYARGTAEGDQAACMVAKQISYNGNRDQAGNFRFTVEAQSNGFGLEWGVQMTAGKRTDASATAAAAVTAQNYAAVNTNGFQAYIQVFSLGSGTPTVKFQSSSDNGADAYADVVGGTFGAVTANTAARIAVAGSVEQYLKVVTTGTFTNLVFSVVVVRNDTAVTF